MLLLSMGKMLPGCYDADWTHTRNRETSVLLLMSQKLLPHTVSNSKVCLAPKNPS